jgi:HPt (histidine-containing phosphotransfer) domain-containing protein
MTDPMPAVLVSTLADDPDLAPLVDAFLVALPDRLRTMHAARDADDLVALGMEAHRLKGAAGGYGFPDLTEAARAVEHAARQEPADVDHALARLQSLADAALRGAPAPPRTADRS